jgi:hypothetical protein
VESKTSRKSKTPKIQTSPQKCVTEALKFRRTRWKVERRGWVAFQQLVRKAGHTTAERRG